MRLGPTTPFGRSRRSQNGDSPRPLQQVGAYISLTKPRVIELLLITTIPTMFLAAGGWPNGWLLLSTLGGGAFAAGASNVLNCIIDRDIDAIMNRTKKRPLATGTISVKAATIFATTLAIAATLWLGFAVNWLSAGLAMGALGIYVLLYSIVLKRRTPQNIVWGGIAGCVPVLIGWSAVTGRLDWAPFALFGVVFFWTPPHYWPLSMKFRRDYAAADVPMLPVVASNRHVALEMIAYTVAMVVCSLLLIPLAKMTWIYAAGATVLGGWFLAECVLLYRRSRDPKCLKLKEMRVFHGSISYLTVLSILITIDPLVR